MSLSSAISNSLSGLTATARGTEIVSTNVSNKSVAGYARRELDLSSRVHTANGGGVSIDGVRRMLNAGLLADNRLSQAGAAHSSAVAGFHATMEASFGAANVSSSLVSFLTSFDAALVSASARPDAEVRLQEVLDSATGLARKIRDIANAIGTARTQADKAISSDVGRLNAALERVATLNRQITAMDGQGQDPSSLIDARQAALDDIAGIVPIVEVARENGRIAIFTKGGATLLDGNTPAKIEFTHVGQISPDMNVGNGALNTVSIAGKALGAGNLAALAGGSLAAHFEIRDSLAPAYQEKIDSFAHEIYGRFADSALDSSLAPDEHGLFSDGQDDLTAGSERGLANRISIANEMNPEQGGALWRIRAGKNAAGAADPGESGLLLRMSAALTMSSPPKSSALTDTPRSLLGLASECASQAATSRIRSDAKNVQDQTAAESLKTALLAGGVDTDSEMQALLALEKTYAANAKVLQIANTMLDELLRL